MAQTQYLDSEFNPEEAAPSEPMECHPQEREVQESHEADQTQAPPNQLEKSDEEHFPAQVEKRTEQRRSIRLLAKQGSKSHFSACSYFKANSAGKSLFHLHSFTSLLILQT